MATVSWQLKSGVAPRDLSDYHRRGYARVALRDLSDNHHFSASLAFTSLDPVCASRAADTPVIVGKGAFIAGLALILRVHALGRPWASVSHLQLISASLAFTLVDPVCASRAADTPVIVGKGAFIAGLR